MNATLPNASMLHPSALWQQVRKIGPLGLIILLHVAFFYALQSGLIHQAIQAMPKEVFATFITPERAPEPTPPKPTPAPPKVVNVVKHVVQPKPTPIPVSTEPSPTAIAVAPTPPAEPTPPAAAPTPAPAAPAAPAGPRLVTTGVEYLRTPPPVYPSVSKRGGEEGTVMLRVVINEKGLPDSVTVQKSSGSSRLDDAARQAVQRWTFKPYMENGKPLLVAAIVPLTFKLDN